MRRALRMAPSYSVSVGLCGGGRGWGERWEKVQGRRVTQDALRSTSISSGGRGGDTGGAEQKSRQHHRGIGWRACAAHGAPTHPMMTIDHSRMLSSSTRPALNPSTGFFWRSGVSRRVVGVGITSTAQPERGAADGRRMARPFSPPHPRGGFHRGITSRGVRVPPLKTHHAAACGGAGWSWQCWKAGCKACWSRGARWGRAASRCRRKGVLGAWR